MLRLLLTSGQSNMT